MAIPASNKEDVRALISLLFVFIAMIWPLIEELFTDLLTAFPGASAGVVGIGTATIGVYFGVRKSGPKVTRHPLGLPSGAVRTILLVMFAIGLGIGLLDSQYMNWGFIAGFAAAVIGWAYG